MTFNFDLNDYQTSQYHSQALEIADQLMSRGLIELTEEEIVNVVERMTADKSAKFVKKLQKAAKNKRNAVKLASVITQAHNENTNGLDELADEFYGEF